MSTDHQRNVWADLAPDLLELIIQKLTLMDYLKCREICSSWRKAVNDALATKGRRPPASQLPFLLTISGNDPAKLMSLTQKKVLTISTQSWVGAMHNVQPVEGWLMFNTYYYVFEEDQTCCELSFFNPVSRVRFKLPKLSLFSSSWNQFKYNRVAFAFAPDSPDFLVVYLIALIHQGQVKQRLAFCKVMHASWTYIETAETQTCNFRDIAVHDGKLYASTVDVTNFVIVFSLKDAHAITVERLVMLDPKPIPRRGHFEVISGIHHYIDNELFIMGMDNTRGELLLVSHIRDSIMHNDIRKYRTHRTKGFRVFKLDLNGPRWIEIKHLGDRLLFLDCSKIRVVSARGLDGAQEFNGGNCIFFCIANTFCVDPFPAHDIGVFSLLDKSIKRFPASSSLPISVHDMWLSPSP